MQTKSNPMVVVSKIVREGDRTLLYSRDWLSRGNEYWFKIIAGTDVDARVGDTVEYEPAGLNFGWFISKK
jgi:hypothetical protein